MPSNDIYTMTPGSAVANTLQEILTRKRLEAQQNLVNRLQREDAEHKWANQAAEQENATHQLALQAARDANLHEFQQVQAKNLEDEMFERAVKNLPKGPLPAGTDPTLIEQLKRKGRLKENVGTIMDFNDPSATIKNPALVQQEPGSYEYLGSPEDIEKQRNRDLVLGLIKPDTPKEVVQALNILAAGGNPAQLPQPNVAAAFDSSNNTWNYSKPTYGHISGMIEHNPSANWKMGQPIIIGDKLVVPTMGPDGKLTRQELGDAEGVVKPGAAGAGTAGKNSGVFSESTMKQYAKTLGDPKVELDLRKEEATRLLDLAIQNSKLDPDPKINTQLRQDLSDMMSLQRDALNGINPKTKKRRSGSGPVPAEQLLEWMPAEKKARYSAAQLATLAWALNEMTKNQIAAYNIK
jgi:hypothetical protein